MSAMLGLAAESELILQDFSPISLDVSPLQKLLYSLVQQVEQCQKDYNGLREELNQLKVARRLDTLESGLQSVAEELQELRAATDIRTVGEIPGTLMARGGGTLATGNGGESIVALEVTQLRDRMAQLDKRSEALWHAREADEELRAAVERLKVDQDTLTTSYRTAASGITGLQQQLTTMESISQASATSIQELQARASSMEAAHTSLATERADDVTRHEGAVGSLGEQLQQMEAGLTQRLAQTEVEQAKTIKEVDAVKESTVDLNARCDDLKRLIGAVETKLESFNARVSAAMNPLHTSLANITIRLDELKVEKQDVATAVTMKDVDAAATRCIAATELKAASIMKAMALIEQRMEGFAKSVADKNEVVFHSDLAACMAAQGNELIDRINALDSSIATQLASKVDEDALTGLEGRVGQRATTLEGAILKGLKAISEKVSGALGDKVDSAVFNNFKGQVVTSLSDVNDRLRDWSPTSRLMRTAYHSEVSVGGFTGSAGSGHGAAGQGHSSACLACDSRVRSAKDLKSSGFGSEHRVFSPEKLPMVGPFHTSSARTSVDVNAFNSAKVAHRQKEALGTLRAPAGSLPEPLPSSMSKPEAHVTAVVDPNHVGLSPSGSMRGSRIRCEVETVTSQGLSNLPTRQKQVTPLGSLPFTRHVTTQPEISGWESPVSPKTHAISLADVNLDQPRTAQSSA